MCRLNRAQTKSVSKWKKVRSGYRRMLLDIVKGADIENYNKIMVTRDYDA